MSENRTHDLIRALARDAAAQSIHARTGRSRLSFKNYSASWLFGAAIIIALSFWLLPIREDLRVRFTALESIFLYIFWLLATILPALKVYTLAFPDGVAAGVVRKAGRYALVPLLVLGTWSLAHITFSDFAFQLYRESAQPNGGCGLVIFTGGLIHASFLFSWIRRGATTSPFRAGAFAALSTASFASFIVQFACPNEHPLHVLFWHFIPMFVLTGLAGITARRLLKW
jgi:hypothetical protein